MGCIFGIVFGFFQWFMGRIIRRVCSYFKFEEGVGMKELKFFMLFGGLSNIVIKVDQI